MAVAEELQIIIDAKVTQAVKDLRKIDDSLGKNEKSSNKLMGAFKSLAGPLAIGAVIATTIRLGKEFSKAASDAEETKSKFETVFRKIGFEAENAAERLADSFGLADSTAYEMLGTTGDLLTGLGFTASEALNLSEKVNTLAIDLASFSNYAGGAKGASEALTKALLGESEMAKGLGIVINQNTKEYKDAIRFYTEVEGKTLMQAKAYTALKFATEQSGNAIGDAQATWNSAANVTKRLEESSKAYKEELGAVVNEGLTPLKSRMAEINKLNAQYLKDLREVKEANQNQEEGVGTLADSYILLNDKLKKEQAVLADIEEQSSTLQDFEKEGYEQLIKYNKDKIAMTERQIGSLKRQQGAISDTQLAAQAKAEADATADAEKLTREEQLAIAYAKTEESQIAALEKSIAFFETFEPQGPMAIAILKMLNEELEKTVETEKILSAQDIFGGKTAVADEWLAKQMMILNQEISNEEARTAAEEKAFDEHQKMIAEKIALAQQYATTAMGLITAIASIGSATDDAEMQSLREKLDARVDAAEIAGASDTELKELVKSNEEELDKKKRQIDHDEAVRKRNLGILNATVDTASAIIGMLANPGGVAGIILSGIAAATGVAQIAAIAAAPIPAYATGGSYVTQGPALVGDNVSGQERVDITPLGGSGGGGSEKVTLTIDGESFWGVMQRGVNNRKIHSSAGGAL